MGWVEDMSPGTTLTAEVRGIVETAMLAYSDRQRRVMIGASVRFWSAQTLPPEFYALGPGNSYRYATSGAMRYLPDVRIVQLFPLRTVTVNNVRHELAHCWDHVRQGNVRSLCGLSGQSLFSALNGSVRMTLSSTASVGECLNSYRGRIAALVLHRRLRPGCRPQVPSTPNADFYKLGGWNYPSRDAREFYAECYRIFHAPSSEAGAAGDHARLWLYAREMYNLLAHESRSEQSPVPDPAAIQAAIQLECLPDP